ncbi:MAG: AI-2E family transporter [Bacteroidota bacterium]
MPESTTKFNIINVAAWLLSIGLLLALIIVGKSYLVPIFMALVIWYLVNALSQLFQRIPLVGKYLPDSVTLIMSLLFIGLALYQVGDVLVGTVQGFLDDSQKYLPRIEAQITKVVAVFRPDAPPYKLDASALYNQVLLNWTELLSGLGNFAKGLFLVLLYVLFFIIEQSAFGSKMEALGLGLDKPNRLSVVLKEVNTAMRTYLGVKTLTSLLTAILSWIVFVSIGLDFALFWAFLIFLFNYIPSIGYITATGLPALLALVQFDSLSPFLIVALGVSAIQVMIGNILEPRLMGDNLNISPLVVVLALILWSLLWGVVGMLLSVPITVAIIIICAQFPSTRKVAILLSKDGKV